MRGLLITFEGIEGCGKSTQANYLYQELLKKGIDVFLTREPGGTELGKSIRNLVLHSHKNYPIAELLLFLADRNQHVNEIIKPVMNRGGIVICDRYYHSTYAYQVSGRKVDLEMVKSANNLATEGLKPDLTFLIDVSVELGFERKKSIDKGLDRIESEEMEFHQAVRDAYLKLVKEEPMITKIDGSRKKEEIRDEILKIFRERFPKY